MRSCPNTFLLSCCSWDVFATLTYRGSPPADVLVAIGHARLWLELMRCRMRLRDEDYYWFLRPERGEAGGRLHSHVLIRVPPAFRSLFVVPRGCLSQAHKLWGRGMTSCRKVDDAFDVAAWYVQKCDGSRRDEYENGKTAAASWGVPSDALVRRALRQQSAWNPRPVTLGGPTSTLEPVPI